MKPQNLNQATLIIKFLVESVVLISAVHFRYQHREVSSLVHLCWRFASYRTTPLIETFDVAVVGHLHIPDDLATHPQMNRFIHV